MVLITSGPLHPNGYDDRRG
ncbi:hypothetical protein AVEN_231788-1, partial [Araneus ventricosus]